MSELRQASLVFSVTQLTEKLRENLERGFPYIWVRGEITNFSRSAQGHIYFSLKDEICQLSCVWFSRQQRQRSGQTFDPFTGEVFENPRPDPGKLMRNGLEVLCGGPISIYRPRGQYQLVVDQVMPTGEGSLALAFEERKRKYAELGYFELTRKRKLPPNPRRIALLTSPHGAAIHDFLRIIRNRGLGSAIRLFPVPVQGEGAAEKIALAMAQANDQNWAEIIVILRGGGSLEDLWAFNEDVLTNAVFNSRLPVVAGIGHEVDFTMVDMTADVRAATPSHAAQILWPLRREITQTLDELELNLAKLAFRMLENHSRLLDREIKTLRLLSPRARFMRLEEQLERENLSLNKQLSRFLRLKNTSLQFLMKSLSSSWNPVERINARRNSLKLLGKSIEGLFSAILAGKEAKLVAGESGLRQATDRLYQVKNTCLERQEYKLKTLDPLEPLHRGYALLFYKNGIVRSVNDSCPGHSLRALLQDGELDLRVEKIRSNTDNAQN